MYMYSNSTLMHKTKVSDIWLNRPLQHFGKGFYLIYVAG